MTLLEDTAVGGKGRLGKLKQVAGALAQMLGAACGNCTHRDSVDLYLSHIAEIGWIVLLWYFMKGV